MTAAAKAPASGMSPISRNSNRSTASIRARGGLLRSRASIAGVWRLAPQAGRCYARGSRLKGETEGWPSG